MILELKETIKSEMLKIDNLNLPMDEVKKKFKEEVEEIFTAIEKYENNPKVGKLTNIIEEMLDLVQMIMVLNRRLMNEQGYENSLVIAQATHTSKYWSRGWETGNTVKIEYINPEKKKRKDVDKDIYFLKRDE